MGLPILGALAAALPVVGSLLDYRSQANTNAATAHQADLSRNFDAEQALQNRQFQESLSNTAYQRATADMRSAGLNPMLAYSQGGASTPGGSMASSPTPSFTAPRLGEGFQRAAQAFQDLKLASATTAKESTAADLNTSLAVKADAEARASRASAANDEFRLASILPHSAVKEEMTANLVGHEEAFAPRYFRSRSEREDYEAEQARWKAVVAKGMSSAELRYHEAKAKGEELGLPGLKARSEMWKGLIPWGKEAGDLFSSAHDYAGRADKVLGDAWRAGRGMPIFGGH
ncbi:MAG: DNA pilot protein [Microviridae sp.]|nr:MAG: DNA pilot protein [Microviridae sp.]